VLVFEVRSLPLTTFSRFVNVSSLAAGLPTIIKPFFGDQHFYADRVSTLGIGSHVRNFTVENLTEALEKAVTDETQIERARLAGEEIRKVRFSSFRFTSRPSLTALFEATGGRRCYRYRVHLPRPRVRSQPHPSPFRADEGNRQ
jgi:hypothetical protein